MGIKCQECKQERCDSNFYKIIRQRKNNKGVYTSYIICKDCIMKEYIDNSEGDFSKGLIYICEKYNVYYDINLVNSISSNEIPDFKNLFKQYIRYISCMLQYNGLKYKDSVFTSNIIVEEIIDSGRPLESEEKTDIDFINDDIKMIKRNMKNATFKNDANAHGKWMNSLRDALELRENLIVKEAIEIDKKNSIIIGNALKSISERIICHDILGKVNEMAGIITSNDNVYDILKGISYNWNHLSKETRDDLAKLIAGEKDKSYLIVLLDSFSK